MRGCCNTFHSVLTVVIAGTSSTFIPNLTVTDSEKYKTQRQKSEHFSRRTLRRGREELFYKHRLCYHIGMLREERVWTTLHIGNRGALIVKSDYEQASADIRHFQDVLRKFPPRPNKDVYTIDLKDISCVDCDAIFSSRWIFAQYTSISGPNLIRNSAELDNHRFSKFCPGAAIVVHVMMRDK